MLMINMAKHNFMERSIVTRAEWLSRLKTGDAVLLRTQLRTYHGVADRSDGERLWVLFAMGDAINSATWVDPITGANPQTHVAILPPQEHEPTDAREGVKTGDLGQLHYDPLPNHQPDCSASEIGIFEWEAQ